MNLNHILHPIMPPHIGGSGSGDGVPFFQYSSTGYDSVHGSNDFFLLPQYQNPMAMAMAMDMAMTTPPYETPLNYSSQPQYQNPMAMATPPYGMLPNYYSPPAPSLELIDGVLVLNSHLHGMPTPNQDFMVVNPPPPPEVVDDNFVLDSDHLSMPPNRDVQFDDRPTYWRFVPVTSIVLAEETQTNTNTEVITSTRGLSKEMISAHLPTTKILKQTSQDSDDGEGADICPVCYDGYEGDQEMGVLGCGHSYHSHCIHEWLLRQNTCPLCRSTALKV